jgi:mannose-6-phosphate isomerase-like protein (cupin superfamily)
MHASKGVVRFVYSDGREEMVKAGEVYFVPPGHTFQVLEEPRDG